MAKLHDLLLNGQIADIVLGMLPEQVERRWGPAQDRSLQRRPLEILKYGSVELTFKPAPDTDDLRLISIAIYFFNPKRSLPPRVGFEDWSPTGETTESQFRDFLFSINLNVHSRVDGENTNLVLESGASAVFVEGHLHSIHFRRRDRGTVRRQMSVSIPETALDQLRERAQREKVPLDELIERILTSKA